MAKNVSPITRSEFFGTDDEPRKPLMATIEGGIRALLTPKNTASGGFGYGSNGQVVLEIAGKAVPCTLGINLTVNGSQLLDDAQKVQAEVAKAKEAKAAARK